MRKQQEKIRKQPIYRVAGDPYEVHVKTMELVDCANPLNRLKARDMTRQSDHLEFIYDRILKTIQSSSVLPAGRKMRDFEIVRIRSIEALDPQGMFALIAQGEHPSPPQWWAELPKLTIAGTDFYVDDRSLFQVDNPWNEIPISGILIEEGRQVLYYDLNEKNIPFFENDRQIGCANGADATIRKFEVPPLDDWLPARTKLREFKGTPKRVMVKKMRA